MSTPVSYATADKWVDGSKAYSLHSGTCGWTDIDENAWWYVDLQVRHFRLKLQQRYCKMFNCIGYI